MATQAQINALTGLYVGYFKRSPDPAGLQFWIDQLNGGRDFTTIAQDFAKSKEARDLYPYLANPGSSSPLDFISTIYQNLFNRSPDAAGMTFWYEVLTEGMVSIGDMIEAVLNGARDSDARIVENKIEVAYDWTNSVSAKPGFTYDADAAAVARTAIADITMWVASVKAAKAQTDAYVAGNSNIDPVLPKNTNEEIKLIDELEEKILKSFQNEWDHIENLSDAKAWHYARNEDQESDLDYIDVLQGDFRLASNAASALHRINSAGDEGNEQNSKWFHSSGAEYVFKYVGTEEEGQFYQVKSDRNLGTFNYVTPTSPSKFFQHENLDVDPWILWGNSELDARSWKVSERNEAYSYTDGFKTFVTDDVETKSLQFGSANDDYLVATAEVEILDGGPGKDIVSYQNGNSAIVVSLDRNIGSEGYARDDEFFSIEGLVGSRFGDILVGDESNNVLAGGSGADILLGLIGNDTLDGGFGNDTLEGGLGDDYLDGGSGDDVLRGGDGNDHLDGGPGRDYLNGGSEDTQEGNPIAADIVDYGASRIGVTVSLAEGRGTAGDAEGDILVDIENIFGSQHGDELTGSLDNNLILGFEGDDSIYGLSGDDYLEGGSGGDLIDGGSGNDFISYANSNIGVHINLDSGFAAGGEAEGDTFINIENLNGSTGNDTLTGDGGDNWINGHAGDDFIAGLGGRDTFFFEDGDGNDTIIDFETGASGRDLINISRFDFNDFDDMLNSTFQYGSDILIQLDDDDSLTLLNFAITDLYRENFFI